MSGPIPLSSEHALERSDASKHANHITAHHCLEASSLEDDIRRFWEIEEPPSRAILTPDDEECEKHFLQTHSRTSTGRFVVRLPFKTGAPIEIGNSRVRAEKQLHALFRRLLARPDHLLEYREFLAEYRSLGHLHEVPPPSDSSNSVVYLPHHPVFRESSVTTHLRVVFNASSITSNGSSLNQLLQTGPKLQTDLPAVILLWRQFRFVYSADITKMYRQILVDSRDLDCQRILWKESVSGPVTEYQLLTVTYGMACAPFLALRVLQQLATDDGPQFPLAVPVLSQNIYVDDVLFGHDDAHALREIREQLIALLRRGGFELRKWASNSSDLLSDIDSAEHGIVCNKLLSVNDNVNILGIGWNPKLDAFQINVSSLENPPTTKRTILAAIARLYDPLGWVTPVVLSAKIIMQQLWRAGVSWDERVPDTILEQWLRVYDGIPHLRGVRIPRWSGFTAHSCAELHGFADASNIAYSAIVYLRVVDPSNAVNVTMLYGKSKVAPLKTVSIPRLELLGAALLSRLLDFVRVTLNLDHRQCHCWSDSTIVLAWIRQHPSRWKTFVANRVADIQVRLPGVEWHHVPTNENPADCASRGLIGDELASHALWWHGPSWLKLSRDRWPRTSESPADNDPPERKAQSYHSSKTLLSWDLAGRYSSWAKLIRVTAYILRFVKFCRRVKVKNRVGESSGASLTAAECEIARIFWLKQIQSELFAEELRALASARCLSSKNPLLSLSPFLDQNGVLRVGGRLKRASSPLAARHPILLAPHPLVRLIVEQTHMRTLHAGLQLTLSTLRRDFWVLRARNLVKSVVHRCLPCVRERAATPTQIMGDLPSVRVNVPSRSFQHCGLDYAGPVAVRASAGRGVKSRKAYIALFVCLASRAVHLELVSDYSTSAFLAAFSRFCSRRGRPQSVYSDNGTNFVGADRELCSAYRAALRDPSFQGRVASDEVAWHFIPPASPHFGGIWEAGVRSVKHHLRRVLGNHTLTFEELTTLLYRIEACLNSRPIAPLSDNLDTYDCLTPGHFLIGSSLIANPEPSLLNLNENRLSRWQLLHQLTEKFWRLWQSDYVNTLQQRSKWRKEQPPVRVGQLVLVKNPTLPPCRWELGRIVKCHPGHDGFVRVISVRTAASEYTRPIGRICLLPIDCDATPV